VGFIPNWGQRLRRLPRTVSVLARRQALPLSHPDRRGTLLALRSLREVSRPPVQAERSSRGNQERGISSFGQRLSKTILETERAGGKTA
jgi:hypothetical protein